MEAKREKLLSFEGLIAPTFNSYDIEGNVTVDGIPKYAQHLNQNGVAGVFLNGTTGDSICLSIEERKRVAEKWITEGVKWLDLIIIHIGTSCMEQTKELAKHAEQLKADAIAVLPPLYYRPNNDDELITYLGEVSSSAPSTPLMLYHIPSLSGVNVNLSTFVEKAQREVPNFCGAKYTSTDLRDLVFTQAKYKNSFKLMLGSDELFLAALPYGINASIGITYNMMASIVRRIIGFYQKGELGQALKEQNAVIEILQKLLRHGSLLQVLRVAMNVTTPIDVGNPRQPQYPLKEESLMSLLKDIETCNFN